MTRFRFRPGAKVCAVVMLTLLTGCGDQRSILAPTGARLDPRSAVQPADLTPGTTIAGPPALSLYNSDFRYTYPKGTYSTDPQTWVQLDVAEVPVTVNWRARPRGGSRVWAYRWTLDIADLMDETPRVNEATDFAHWSQRSLSTVSATVGPFAAGEQHLLYVEVTDSNGLKSLGTVHMRVVESVSGPGHRR